MQRFITGFLFLAAGLTALNAQVLTMQDGTPVRLRLNRTVSSATAHVGDMVDFEVTDPVVVQNVVVIPKGSLAFGRISKVEAKRRFGRAGELEISVDTVRLVDGGSAPLRATSQEGDADLHGGRLAATIVASPVLVWVKGKNVELERGQETTAYIRGDVKLDEAVLRQRPQGAPAPRATDARDSGAGGKGSVLTNRDIVQMKEAGLSDDVILTKIQTSETDFRTDAQDLIDLKTAGLSEQIIQAILQKASRR